MTDVLPAPCVFSISRRGKSLRRHGPHSIVCRVSPLRPPQIEAAPRTTGKLPPDPSASGAPTEQLAIAGGRHDLYGDPFN